MREVAELSVKEWMARAERAERELGSKRQVIGGFEATKRSEIEALRDAIEKLSMEMRETEMTLEEVWSRGSAVTSAYWVKVQEIDDARRDKERALGSEDVAL
jgi:hypothetical protein